MLILNILAIIANIIYYVVLRKELYTIRAILLDGESVYSYTPIELLSHAGNDSLAKFQFVFAVISIALSVVMAVGFRKKFVDIAWIISTVVATVLFAAILLYAGSVNLVY